MDSPVRGEDKVARCVKGIYTTLHTWFTYATTPSGLPCLWVRLGLGEQPFLEVDKDACPKSCIWGASLPFWGQ